MDAILRAVTDGDGDGDDTVLGDIAKETPEGKLLEKWSELIKSSNFQLNDITNGLADLFATKQFVVPKLEKVTDEEINPTLPNSQVQSELETQPIEQQKASKKKRANKTTAIQKGPKNWTEDEEAALTRAWIFVRDNMTAHQQSHGGFWERVLNHFHSAMGMGVYRNNDALSGKWRDIKIKVKKFNGIYNNIYMKYKKGKSDFDIFNMALEQYRCDNGGKPFAHLKAWEIMRNAPKWVLNSETLSQTCRSKRPKTSESNEYTVTSDARNPIDSYDADEIPVEEPVPSVVGQDKGKQVVSSSGNNPTESNDSQYLKAKIDEYLQLQKQKMELKRDQQILTDMQVLQLSTNNVEGEDLETMLAVKRAIREKYKKICNF